jgi:hypothetical protein
MMIFEGDLKKIADHCAMDERMQPRKKETISLLKISHEEA